MRSVLFYALLFDNRLRKKRRRNAHNNTANGIKNCNCRAAGFKQLRRFKRKGGKGGKSAANAHFKQSEVEPDMPKMGRRGDFSHFCPCLSD